MCNLLSPKGYVPGRWGNPIGTAHAGHWWMDDVGIGKDYSCQCFAPCREMVLAAAGLVSIVIMVVIAELCSLWVGRLEDILQPMDDRICAQPRSSVL